MILPLLITEKTFRLRSQVMVLSHLVLSQAQDFFGFLSNRKKKKIFREITKNHQENQRKNFVKKQKNQQKFREHGRFRFACIFPWDSEWIVPGFNSSAFKAHFLQKRGIFLFK